MPYKDKEKIKECWKRQYMRRKSSEEWKQYDRQKSKIIYLKNKDKRAKQFKDYYNKNRDKINAYLRLKYLTKERTPKQKIDKNLGYQLWRFLKKKKAGRRWEDLVGYSFDTLYTHLENLFDDKMNWDNYGKYWSIDHIKPVSLFKYNSIDDEEVRKCWALTNLRPLNHIENIKKGNKYELPKM